METQLHSNHWKTHTRVLGLMAVALLTSSCAYMKMDPPPDVDKANLAGNNSCYLATASNMLAGAGYGDGNSVQARADDIYGDLTGQFGIANSGWTDTALSWWLSSNHNTWTNNPYTVVTVFGNKIPKNPWANANGARDIANELRACNFVGLSISWPTNQVNPNGTPVIGSGGHAITGWGDSSWLPWKGYNDPLSGNPSQVRLTDSDRDTGGDVQTYRYDNYTNPNPGGANEGNGWYFDFDPNHPYIKHIVTLSPTQTAAGRANIQRVVGSYKLFNKGKIDATDLHYKVGTDTDILSYHTRVSWLTETPPDITESEPSRTELEVDWDFSNKPLPPAGSVTITTEFILRNWNAMSYDDVHFTYPDGVAGSRWPAISWDIRSKKVDNAASIPNVTGGYVVASFDLLDEAAAGEQNLVAQYRLLHQYSFDQSPESHTFTLAGQQGLKVTNLRFGHTYGLLKQQQLWAFADWMTDMNKTSYTLGDEPVAIDIDWQGRLPYPEGENVFKRLPDIKKGLMKERPEEAR